LLGLGPGDPGLLTRQAWAVLENSPEIYLRTRHHPVVAGLPPNLTLHSFDDYYESGDAFEEIYDRIVERILELGRRPQGVIYAVPGHPLVAESTGPEILRRAKVEGIDVRVVEGMSFLEPVLTLLELDPFPRLILMDAFELSVLETPPFPSDSPVLIAQIHSSAMAAEVKLTLAQVLADEYPVVLVHAAGTPQALLEHVPLYAIDRSWHIGLLTCLYVPGNANHASIESLLEVIARLRAPDGCPWDQEQDHRSLRPFLVEETYEALAAIDAGNPTGLAEELGDVLFQVAFHARIAQEEGEFDFSDIVRSIREKLVRRHPHVFAGWKVEGVEQVVENWERLKADEHAQKGRRRDSALDGVETALPALVLAAALQKKAGRSGFEWPDISGVWAKLAEELKELEQAGNLTDQVTELGDVLFVAAHLGNWLGIHPEDALREACTRFRRRFEHMERSAAAQGRAFSDLPLAEMELLWQEAKKHVDRR